MLPKIPKSKVINPPGRAFFKGMLAKDPTFSRRGIIGRLNVLANLTDQELTRLAPEGIFPLVILTENFRAPSPTLPKIIRRHQKSYESELDILAVKDIDSFAWLIAQDPKNNFTYQQLVEINGKARTNSLK